MCTALTAASNNAWVLPLGDDKLQLEELERVMGECLRESGLELPEIDVQVKQQLHPDQLQQLSKLNYSSVNERELVATFPMHAQYTSEIGYHC